MLIPGQETTRRFYLEVIIGSAYSLIFLALIVLYEWSFHLTKLSFFYRSAFSEALSVLLCALAVPSLFIFALSIALLLLGSIPGASRFRSLWARLSIVSAALFLATFLFVVADGFLYTLLDLGVLSLRSMLRYLFAFLYLALFAFALRALRISLSREARSASNRACLVSAALILTCSTTFAWFRFYPFEKLQLDYTLPTRIVPNLPDIYLIGADGTDASHLAIYGYGRSTTPFLETIAKDSLVFLNAFADTNSSTGSLTTMLTGKSPVRTRVLHYPDILRGVDAYQHLPGILRLIGYRSIELGLRRYADSFDVNLRAGFEEANFRSLTRFPLNFACNYSRICNSLELYLLIELEEKIVSRIKHAFGLEKVTNVYKFILDPHVFGDHDLKLTEALQEFVENSQAPVFGHVHFVGTHGPSFLIQERRFSEGKLQTEATYADFYDDALLSFDRNLEKFFKFLQAERRLANSLFIFYSDHDSKHLINVRIPLIIYSPNRELTGHIKRNVSLLDISPTILDYIGAPQANWFEGTSLLAAAQPGRRIITAKAKNPGDKDYSSPPFFNFEELGLVSCNQGFKLVLASDNLGEDQLSPIPEECKNQEPLTSYIARSELLGAFEMRNNITQPESKPEIAHNPPR